MVGYNQLRNELCGSLIEGAPLSEYTTWRLGGPADALLNVACAEDVVAGVRFARRCALPLTVIGNGSNLLVRDGGLRGLVIRLGDQMQKWSVTGTTLTAQAGCILAKMARETASRGLAGLHWAAGIPASLGGASIMNAGAYGHCFYETLATVTVVTPDGAIVQRSVFELTYGYRQTSLSQSGDIVTDVCVKLSAGDREELSHSVEETLRVRRRNQPLELPSAGSVFRNPPGDHAGRLVEAAGLRGLRRGQMQVSEKHGNFIVNLGGGTAADTLALIATVQKEVKSQFGVELTTEVRIIGEDAGE